MANELGPDRSVRLLRAKQHEYENLMQQDAVIPVSMLVGDMALLFALLAEHIERTEWTP